MEAKVKNNYKDSSDDSLAMEAAIIQFKLLELKFPITIKGNFA